MDGDTTFTKLFVGGLAWETRRDTVRSHFERFGEIVEAVVIVDKHTGRSKGYGFVTFRDPEAAARALQDPTPVIDGRRANCKLAAFGIPRLSPAMIAWSPSYQGCPPGAMATYYFPQPLYANPYYYYGYDGGYSPDIMYQTHMGYYGGYGYGVSGTQQQQAQPLPYNTAARPAGVHQVQHLQAAGDQTRSSHAPAVQNSQTSQRDYVQKTQHKPRSYAAAVAEKPSGDEIGRTATGSVSGASEGSPDRTPVS
ncbi:RNA-binding protein 24-like [Oryza brachyantha]|uniref:RNA-binding protein 24-like n=1 Tax=Oryza brachyantha TaxID=4533 RepID=UPI0007765C72|nr:RNA-binding protein 24-like [Oryza brachyantha]